MRPATFRGHVDDDGALRLYNQSAYTVICKRLAGKRVTLTIGDEKPTRSSNQHRYYFGVVVKTLADELGYTSDEMHEALKFKFLRTEPEPERGRILDTVRSTTKIRTDEMEDYLDRIRMWAAADLGIVVPLPNEVPEMVTA